MSGSNIPPNSPLISGTVKASTHFVRQPNKSALTFAFVQILKCTIMPEIQFFTVDISVTTTSFPFDPINEINVQVTGHSTDTHNINVIIRENHNHPGCGKSCALQYRGFCFLPEKSLRVTKVT